MADFESLYWGSAQLNMEMRQEIARLKQANRDQALTIDRLQFLLATQPPAKPTTEESNDGQQ